MKEGDIVYHWPFMAQEPKNIGVLFERDDDDDAWTFAIGEARTF